MMLSIISVPIGNLGDITARACETLTKCDAIICEDTRVTGKLLELLRLPKRELVSIGGRKGIQEKLGILGRKGIKEKFGRKGDRGIIERLEKGEHFVLVSDAGTPCISDPGYHIVSQAAELGIKIEVIPGPSAFLAALSVSGLPINQFLYLGFLPLKKGRKTVLESFKEEERTIVFYEAPHRILRTLSELADILADQSERRIVLCRELTKLHEEVIRTTVRKLPEVIKSLMVKGEFVLVVGGNE